MSSHESDPALPDTSSRVGNVPGPVRRAILPAALVVVSLVCSSLLGEVLLRTAFPAHRFLDPRHDCFWSLRLGHRLSREPDEQRLFGSGQHDPRIGWKPQPNLRSAERNTNSQGLRGLREYTYAKPPRTLRLVVHGDSFTWGLGVSDTETYSNRIATLLPASEVLNMGINGHGIDQQYLYWMAEGIQYDPDVVVVAFFVGDFHRSALSIREFPKPRFVLERGALRLTGLPVPTPRQYLEVRNTACSSTSRVLDVAGAVARRLRVREGEDSFQLKAALTKGILGRWKDSLVGTDTDLCLVVIPHPRYRDYPDHARIEALLQEAARDHEFAFLNLTEPLQAFEAGGARAYSAHNGHWTAAGHAFAAQRIAEYLGAPKPFRLTREPPRSGF